MDNSTELYYFYKPFKNHLKPLDVFSSLQVIESYVKHLQFSYQFPQGIDVASEFLKLDRVQKMRIVSEWDLEVLAREIIINAEGNSYNKESLTRWNYFSGAVNKLKNLENKVGELFVNSNNILTEMFRLAHRQFCWQVLPNQEFLFRYYKIFNTKDINRIVESKTGLSVKDIYLIGLAFVGYYFNAQQINIPITSNIKGVDREKIEKFLGCFSINFEELKKLLTAERNLDEKFSYSFNSLREFPIIKTNSKGIDCYVCPLLTLLFWRITSGLYYEICKEKGMGEFWGATVQNYVGEIFKKSKTNNNLNILAEEEYLDGKNRKDTIDWIVFDNNSALFIECKAKRLNYKSKIELNNSDAIETELDIMSDSIMQIYKSLNDYINNKFPTFKYNSKISIYPLIITLENWHIFGPQIIGLLNKKIEEKFNEFSLPREFLSKYPFAICALEEWELISQIIQSRGINEVMREKVFNVEKKEWGMGSYLYNIFNVEVKKSKFLFKNEMQEFFSDIEIS